MTSPFQQETAAAQGGTAVFSVRPKTGLAAGVYEESFIIQDTTAGNEIEIHAAFTVDAVSHSLTVSPETLEFGVAKEGYGEIEAKQFTVTNSGNTVETLEQPSAGNFEVSGVDASALTLQPGASVSFTVRPKNGLGVNSYQETIPIASANAQAGISASFQVANATVTVTEIRNPSPVTGLAQPRRRKTRSR